VVKEAKNEKCLLLMTKYAYMIREKISFFYKIQQISKSMRNHTTNICKEME